MNRMRYRYFLSTLVFGIIFTSAINFVSTNSDGGWDQIEPALSSEYSVKYEVISSLSLSTMNKLFENTTKRGALFDYDFMAVYVADTKSCPMIFNDAADYFDLTDSKNVFSTTVIMDEDLTEERLKKAIFLETWKTPVILRPLEISLSELGNRLSDGAMLPQLHLVEIKTGNVINSFRLSSNPAPVERKTEQLADFLNQIQKFETETSR